MSNKIKHSGVVDGVDGTTVRVRILQSSACSACKVASHCNASETKEKLVEVTTIPCWRLGQSFGRYQCRLPCQLVWLSSAFGPDGCSLGDSIEGFGLRRYGSPFFFGHTYTLLYMSVSASWQAETQTQLLHREVKLYRSMESNNINN